MVETNTELEQKRDAKCFPVAKGMLQDMAENLLDNDATAMVTKTLIRFLEADLNVSTEVTYVPQLVLGALAGFNAISQELEFDQTKEAKYKAIAKRILEVVAATNIDFLKIGQKDYTDFQPVKDECNRIVKEENISKCELKYIVDSIFEAYTHVSNIFSVSLEKSVKRMEAKLFGIEDMDFLNMSQLDAILRKTV